MRYIYINMIEGDNLDLKLLDKLFKPRNHADFRYSLSL